MSATPSTPPQSAWVALTGNPNCGKTTLFNALTGLRAKVGNYAGVTVERKEGRLKGAPTGRTITILDLPGTYSLSPKSLDEQISRDVLFNRLPDVPPPTVVIVVADASNLERNLYYATQVIELGYPTILALNMIDVADEIGRQINVDKLAEILGVPVVPLVASTNRGLPVLRQQIIALTGGGQPAQPGNFFTQELPLAFQTAVGQVSQALARIPGPPIARIRAEALLLLTDDQSTRAGQSIYPPPVIEQVLLCREELTRAGLDWRSTAIEARYARLAGIHQETVQEPANPVETVSDRLDRVLTHRIWGLLIFLAVMAAMFQSIFRLAEVPMDWISGGINLVGQWAGAHLPPGALADLTVNGVIAGVGAVVVFLPQILLLFFFISLLEDTGYMARAAFIMDSLMSKVGLHGKSFIPLISSFACAIPGIMATRTIDSPKDRLATMLIAPLMSCSARLPVYAVLIAACIPNRSVLGVVNLPGLTLLSMYLLGIMGAMVMAMIFKRTLLKGTLPMMIMELPPYKRPVAKAIARHMWDRAKLFLTKAGSVILAINILLWFLAHYPQSNEQRERFDQQRAAAVAKALPGTTPGAAMDSLVAQLRLEAAQVASNTNSPTHDLAAAVAAVDKVESGERLRNSFAGRLGRVIEPVIQPLGFDWKIGIGIVASFAAREVFVSTMAIVYNAGDYDSSEDGTQSLARVFQEQKRTDGRPVYTTLNGLTLMVFFVFALQCVSTVVIMRRETNSWRWPIFQWCYMGVLAWSAAYLTKTIGHLLGLG
jgi:ferrous iron transport protein B